MARPPKQLSELALWEHVVGGAEVLLKREEHWVWKLSTVMVNIRGKRQSVRTFLHTELGGEHEFGYALPDDRTWSVGAKCGVEQCVNPWHSALFSKSELYLRKMGSKQLPAVDGLGIRALAWMTAGGVPHENRRQLELLLRLDVLPAYGNDMVQYPDSDGDTITDAGNWYGGSAYFPYAIRWEAVSIEHQIVGADIARLLMLERKECWGHQLLTQGEHFTQRMVTWLHELSPSVLHKEPDWGKCYNGVVRPGEVRYPHWRDIRLPAKKPKRKMK